MDTLIPPPAEDVAQPISDYFTSYFEDLKKQTFEYDEARIHLNRIVDNWKQEVDKTDERRKTRDVDINVQQLRSTGKLDEDETLIPDRVIDTNIQREQPPYINYLKNSRRLAIFTCVSNPDITDSQKLELEFTRGMTYPSWEVPHYKCLDGTQTHGWDAIEVVYDSSKPLKVGLEQIGHDRLFFPRSCLDIQDAAKVVRAYDVTINQLKKFVENNGFSKDQVGTIISVRANTQKESETVRIYKSYCKYDAQVYVSWFCLEYGVDDWLKKPIPLFLGMKTKTTKMVDVSTTMPDPITGLPTQTMTQQPREVWVDTPINQYPIYILPYRETEKPKVIDHKGRVFLDENKQEAQTAILSSFVNALYRASKTYAARDAEDGIGTSLKEEEDIVLTGNRILNKPIKFFQMDYPDPVILKAMQYFDSANAAETNQVNFAANNRQDSRKTAKEISSSEQKEALLNSVQLTLFSTHIRNIYSLCWMIVQSLAMQGKIQFLLVKKQRPKINPVMGQPIPDPNTGQPEIEEYWENDYETIKQLYDVRAAGDTDVIQRSEKIQQMKQDFPVIANTILRDEFLAELIKLQYPDVGEKWAKILLTQGNQFEQMKGLLGQLGNILIGVFKDHQDILMELPPQQQAAIQQMIAQSQQLSQQEPTV